MLFSTMLPGPSIIFRPATAKSSASLGKSSASLWKSCQSWEKFCQSLEKFLQISPKNFYKVLDSRFKVPPTRFRTSRTRIAVTWLYRQPMRRSKTIFLPLLGVTQKITNNVLYVQVGKGWENDNVRFLRYAMHLEDGCCCRFSENCTQPTWSQGFHTYIHAFPSDFYSNLPFEMLFFRSYAELGSWSSCHDPLVFGSNPDIFQK